MRKVKGILIDPFACAVSEVEYDGDDYTQLYPLLSHESMSVDCFTVARSSILKPDDTIFVDDEGLMKGCNRFFQIAGAPQPYAGKGVVLGCNEVGDTVSCKTKLDIVRLSTRFAELIDGELYATNVPWVAESEKAT